ncbi:MAG: 3-hydroxy-3-methylglutaryl-CoA reductase, partial [Anaerolineaceae bacterium]
MTTKPVKFYNLTLPERLQYLQQHAGLTDEQTAALGGDNLSAEAAGRMIENAAGTYALPLGIAQNFVVNGREVLVPMVIEEPSVVAGASFMAKLARAGGGFTARADEPLMIGQMQILDLADPAAAREKLLQEKQTLLDEANRIDPVLQKLGGGAHDIEVRLIEESAVGAFLVLHLIYDVRDAMGANAVNTAVERLTPRVESITGGRVLLRILSNLADRRLAYAECRIPADQLAFEGFSASQVADGIVEAWAFAAADPYRAATHNKGIMNGVDAVVIAT